MGDLHGPRMELVLSGNQLNSVVFGSIHPFFFLLELLKFLQALDKQWVELLLRNNLNKTRIGTFCALVLQLFKINLNKNEKILPFLIIYSIRSFYQFGSCTNRFNTRKSYRSKWGSS